MTDHIPDLLLERLRRGELDPAAADALRARLGAADRDRLDALDTDDARTLEAHPPRLVAAEIRRRLDVAPRRRRAPFAGPALGLALAAAAAAGLLWFAPPAPTPIAAADAGPDTVRAKGDARLLVYRRGSGPEPELLTDGDAARAGDVVQLGVLLDAPRHVAVVSIDGRGALTVHHPQGSAPDALPAGRLVFDHAFAFDDAPAYERFVLVTAPAPIDLEAIRRAVDALDDPREDPLALPADWRQSSTLIVKESL